jgi:hypothetical protein
MPLSMLLRLWASSGVQRSLLSFATNSNSRMYNIHASYIYRSHHHMSFFLLFTVVLGRVHVCLVDRSLGSPWWTFGNDGARKARCRCGRAILHICHVQSCRRRCALHLLPKSTLSYPISAAIMMIITRGACVRPCVHGSRQTSFVNE